MGIFQRTPTRFEPVTATQWPDEHIDIDDRRFAEAIEQGRRDEEVEASNN